MNRRRPSLSNSSFRLANGRNRTVLTYFLLVFFLSLSLSLSLCDRGKWNCTGPGQRKHFGVHIVFCPGLHDREAAEGLPQLFCDRFIELYLLLQVEADDAVVIVDPVTVEVIHLSL